MSAKSQETDGEVDHRARWVRGRNENRKAIIEDYHVMSVAGCNYEFFLFIKSRILPSMMNIEITNY